MRNDQGMGEESSEFVEDGKSVGVQISPVEHLALAHPEGPPKPLESVSRAEDRDRERGQNGKARKVTSFSKTKTDSIFTGAHCAKAWASSSRSDAPPKASGGVAGVQEAETDPVRLLTKPEATPRRSAHPVARSGTSFPPRIQKRSNHAVKEGTVGFQELGVNPGKVELPQKDARRRGSQRYH
jgi:hypothetical protein